MSTGSTLILVVDDDVVSRFMARQALEQANFRVEEASGGAAALTAFQNERPDMILLDVMMPDMDGFSVCRAIRATAAGAHIPILMITGLEDTESIERAYEVGATDFVSKPINHSALGHRVRYMLRSTRTAEELRVSRTRLSHAQRMARLGYWEWDVGSGQVWWSEEISHLLGLPLDTLTGTVDDMLANAHREDRAQVERYLASTAEGNQLGSIEYRVVRSDGSERVVQQEADSACDEGGRVVRVSFTSQDVTERRQAERQIRYLAYYDPLTGLPNRSFLREHLIRVLAQAARQRREIALLYVDLDQFKRVNDSFGHSVGDALLREAAARLSQAVRSGDCVVRGESDGHPLFDIDTQADTVARFGGDEFIVVVGELRYSEDAARVSQRIIASLEQPFVVEGKELFVGASIGIALYPADGRDQESLLKNADAAMYLAKDLGRNNYQFYTESLNAKAFTRLSIEASLRRAVERDEFVLVYQPKLHLQSQRVTGAEALIRWRHPDLGLVSPADFIPIAEETGLIVAIGRWVLQEACRQVRAWQDAGLPPLCVSVNVSFRQFQYGGLVQDVRQAIEAAGIQGQWIEIELTESVLMGDIERCCDVLLELEALGVSVAIDDFGTGYSSLSYLKRLSIDVLKIDRSFVHDILSDPDNQAITTAITYMAHSLKLQVIAEGVETPEQMEFLRRLGCDEIQGYVLSRPVPADELEARFLRTPEAAAGASDRPAADSRRAVAF